MKLYNIMGSHPGDGGQVKANNPKEALVKFFANSYGISQKEIKNKMKLYPK